MEDLINALRQTILDRQTLCEKLNKAKAEPTSTATESRRVCYYNDYIANCKRFERIVDLLATENTAMLTRAESHLQILLALRPT